MQLGWDLIFVCRTGKADSSFVEWLELVVASYCKTVAINLVAPQIYN